MNIIKRNIMFIFTIIVAFALITSCEDKKDDDQHELVGTWEWQKSTYYSPTIAIPDTTWIDEAGELFGMTLEIKDDDTIEMAITGFFEMTLAGTWDVSGSTVTMTVEGDVTEMEYDISGSDLTLTYFEEGDTDFGVPDAWVVGEYTKK
ncbi:MAG: hypothetical protein IIB95_07090 [Candidatus Marinimicrobia bacterium]|nr:hypothetical protein [Candidatus Neomarinimicrobiota bacterium]